MDNYFTLFNLPETFRPDTALVKQIFYRLSKQFHPDRVAQADPASQAEVLTKAAMLNDAYKTLSNADLTMAYILKVHQLLEEEEKYALPPDFLMEMMDINELLSDYEAMPQDERLKSQVEQALAEQLALWEAEVRPLVLAFEEDPNGPGLLVKIKDFYFRKKYLLRIRERLTTFALR
jgi:molecular chaperone HscB